MGRAARRRKRKKFLTYQHPNRDQATIDLFKFLKQNNWENSTNLQVINFVDSGRGIVSKSYIKPDETIIRVPIPLLLTVNSIQQDTVFVNLFKKYVVKDSKISFQSLLAAYLCYLKCENNLFWKPYIDTLPTTLSHPIFCSKAELFCLDETLLTQISRQHSLIKADFSNIATLPQLNEDIFKWAYFIVNSRSVFADLNLDEKTILTEYLTDIPKLALAPLLDLFNHSDLVNTSIILEANQYSLKNNISFSKNEQIFINYGCHNNLKLMCEYGFYIKNNSNDFITITIQDFLKLIKVDPQLRGTLIPRPKFIFIKEHNLEDSMFFDISEGISHNLGIMLMLVFQEKTTINLANLIYGNDLNIETVRDLAIKLANMKKEEFLECANVLRKQTDLTVSANVCVNYYEESARYLSECITTLERL